MASLKLMADHSTLTSTSPSGRSRSERSAMWARMTSPILDRQYAEKRMVHCTSREGERRRHRALRSMPMTRAPFGFWPSPLRAEQAAAGRVSLSELSSDGVRLYWLESRPSEGGRVVLVRHAGNAVEELSPGGVSIRSRVHEYGGGASCLVSDHGPGAFAYVRLDDQRVWLTDGGSAAPRALSSEPPPGEIWAHGGLCATPDGDWIVAVREAHRPGSSHPRHCLVALGTRTDNAGESIVAEGHGFYGAPRVNDAGDRLVTVVWDHP